MSEMKSTTAGSEAWHASPRVPLAFPGVNDGPGAEPDDPGSDWDRIRLIGLIERDGFIRTETLDGDWE